MRAKRCLTAVTIAIGVWSFGAAHAEAGAKLPEGCVAASGTQCAYRAHVVGSVYAEGNGWRVQIQRGTRLISWRAGVANLTLNKRNVIRPGDRVYVDTALAACPPCCFSGETGVVRAGPDVRR